jgi:hypothetical protein
MRKKIIGIFICMLFLFSTLPTTQGTNVIDNKEESFLKSNDVSSKTGYLFIEIAFGRIIYNGEELLDEPWGMCYNITPINAKILGIGIGEGFDLSFQRFKITEDPSYISQNMSKGFIGNNYMFLYRITEA